MPAITWRISMPRSEPFVATLSTNHEIAHVLLKDNRSNSIAWANHHLLAAHLECCSHLFFPQGSPILWDDIVTQGLAAAAAMPSVKAAIAKIRARTKVSNIDGHPNMWKKGTRLLATNRLGVLEDVELGDEPISAYDVDEGDVHDVPESLTFLARTTDGRFFLREGRGTRHSTKVLTGAELASALSLNGFPPGSYLGLLWELNLLNISAELKGAA
jgi:hypothetical protein